LAFDFDVTLLRDQARSFPSGPLDTSIQSLRIGHCKYQSLRGLGGFPHLRVLDIASYPDTTLDPIGDLLELRYLRILHLPKVRSLAPLERLGELLTLALETLPSWDSSGRITEVETLEPIANLPRLRHLVLFGVRPMDQSLKPLQASKSLRSVRVQRYPRAEVARFYSETHWSDAHVPEPSAA